MRSLSRMLSAIFIISASVSGAAEVDVAVARFEQLAFYPQFSAPAEVISRQDSQISAQLSARIERVAVRVGDLVAQGDLLVALDCADYQTQQTTQQALLAELEVQLELARDQLRRAEKLHRAGNLGEDALQQRETSFNTLSAKLRVQQQQIALAELAVSRCEVRAPFSGLVTERSAQLGSLAAPGQTLVRLVQLEGSEVSAQLPAAVRLHDQQSLEFQYRDQRLALSLRAQLPLIDRQTQTREVRLSFVGRAAESGSSGRLVWKSVSAYLPEDLLVRRQHQGQWALGILLAEAGQARFMPLPEAIEGQAVALSLAPETLIITDGRQAVVSGDQLRFSVPGDAP